MGSILRIDLAKRYVFSAPGVAAELLLQKA
jgi:hypothetical protein